MTLRHLPDLPEYYYLDHFHELLGTVQVAYAECLGPDELGFLSAFDACSKPAQGLFVRMANRKTQVFELDQLRYQEIGDPHRAFEELQEAGLAGYVTPEDFAALLASVTRAQVLDWLSEALPAREFKRSWKKAELVAFALSRFEMDMLVPESVRAGYVKPLAADELAYLRFLYFGRRAEPENAFTMRDLGLIRTFDDDADVAARFDDEASARQAFALYYLDQMFPDSPETVCEALLAADIPDHPATLRLHDALIAKAGKYLEDRPDLDRAISLYHRGSSAKAQERYIRLLYKQGGKDAVKAPLEALIDDPPGDEVYLFAADFYARKFKKKRTSMATDLIRSAETLTLDEGLRGRPEKAVCLHLTEQGAKALHAENRIWKALFGLTFWDLIFSSGRASQFDRLPEALKSGQFYAGNREEIETRLTIFDSPARAQVELLKTFAAHFGRSNGVFRWSNTIQPWIQNLLDHAPKGALAHVMRRMAQDYRGHRDGFPDVMVLENGEVRFAEVKTDGDQIRRNQLTRIHMLREAGFQVDIVNVEWQVDPNQTYVVVDVETTGGQRSWHRVTEIGAVKIKGGKIIDEWQSLINPERSIPPMITSLTGISNEMVKDAPVFADIAEDFRDFLGEAIFVAHNVNFDYGFIASEFERTGRRLRLPRMCTCASMRKLHKGLKSYSLKNLCKEFDVRLDNHHRALCDAKAAAELLFIINDKRAEALAAA